MKRSLPWGIFRPIQRRHEHRRKWEGSRVQGEQQGKFRCDSEIKGLNQLEQHPGNSSTHNLWMCLYLEIFFAAVIKLRCNELGWALASLYEEENLDTDTQQKTMWKWRQGLEWYWHSQGTPRIASNRQKLEKARTDSSLQVSEGVWACQHLDFKLLASRTVQE